MTERERREREETPAARNLFVGRPRRAEFNGGLLRTEEREEFCGGI